MCYISSLIFIPATNFLIAVLGVFLVIDISSHFTCASVKVILSYRNFASVLNVSFIVNIF